MLDIGDGWKVAHNIALIDLTYRNQPGSDTPQGVGKIKQGSNTMNAVQTYNQVIDGIDIEELWSETFGSGWEYAEFDIRVKYADGTDWDKPGNSAVAIHNGDQWVIKQVGIATLFDAYKALKAMADRGEYNHCGTGVDLGNFDACVSADLLQLAVLGEIIYG